METVVCRRATRKIHTALGQWVKSQRFNRYCSEKMIPEQRHTLTLLGFDWETIEEKNEGQWNDNFESLKLYRKKHLDCCVPRGFKEDPSLGIWVKTQRKLYQRGKLPAHRKEKLESVEFTWSLQNRTSSKRDTSKQDEKWFVQYEALLEYSQEHGHCMVSEKDKSLGKWVSHQRTTNKEGNMRPDRFTLLEDIEFVWTIDVADPEASLTQRQWDEMYQHLIEFQETHGHPNVPRAFTKWGLGPWVKYQRTEERNGFLDPRRADKLTAIGFTWGKDRDERWEENF
jgi:hypothetical protein